jgi:hypothetical protein
MQRRRSRRVSASGVTEEQLSEMAMSAYNIGRINDAMKMINIISAKKSGK